MRHKQEHALARAKYWVTDCLEQGEAVVVTGGWLLLEEARRWFKAWEGTIVTTRFSRSVHEWCENPQDALLCTPPWILEPGEVLAAVERPLTVVLLASPWQREVIVAFLKGIREAFTVLDVPAGTRTIYDATVAVDPATFKLRPGKVSNQWVWSCGSKSSAAEPRLHVEEGGE